MVRVHFWLFFFLLIIAFAAPANAADGNLPKANPSPHPLEAWFNSVEQAEAVERELLKVIYNDLSLPAKSLMGQLKLALARELKKKHGQSVYSCQRFNFQSARLNSYSIYQSCLPRERPEIIYAEISALGNLEITFYLQNLADVVGFGSSILKRTTRCTLMKKEGELEQMNCQDLGNSRSPEEVMMLDEVLYQKNAPTVLSAQGKFYKELLPSRSLSVFVPKEGKVRLEVKSLYKKPKPVVIVPPTRMALPQTPPQPLKTTQGQERLPGEPVPPSDNRTQSENVPGNPEAAEGVFALPPDVQRQQPEVTPQQEVPPPGDVQQVAPEATINSRGRFEMKPVAPPEGTDHNSNSQ